MEYLLHGKDAYGCLFMETFPPDSMVNGGNIDAFSRRFCGILLAYLDRLVAT